MDANVFMTLLVAQLKNQNPSAPMDTNQMMSQTIQLSMMEKMTELTTNSKEGIFPPDAVRRSPADWPHCRLHPRATAQRAPVSPARSSYAGAVPTVTVGDLSVPLDSITGLTAPAAS